MTETYYIGVDIGKFSHWAAVMTNYGELKVDSFCFTNDKQGFNTFYQTVKPYLSHDHLIGMEDTAHYADNFRHFLLKKNRNVVMINPLSTDAFRKALLKSTKTDKEDARFICQVIMNPQLYRKVKLSDYDYHQIRELTRYHHNMKEANTRYKTQLQKDLDRVFPEFNSLFSAPYGPTYMRILSEFQSAVIISDTDIRTLRKVLKNTGRGRSVSFTAEELKRLAKSSVGQPNTILEMEIRHLVTLIADIDSCIAEVDKKIEEFSLDLNSPILSIPGISHFSGTSIISEIGDVNRFSDVNKLISFAGVNPIVYQSGNTNLKMTRLSKKGSKYLRKTLYQIITPVIQNNTVFMNYYNKKISQGKSPRCAQGHCVRKLLRIIYHILKTGNSFDPDLIR